MLNGIDVAVYQNGLDLRKVEADFVLIKATEGTGYTNPSYLQHYQQAKSSNKLIGFYHYASGNNWKAEADYFLSRVKPYSNQAVLVLDFEATAVSMWGPNGATNFLNYVEQQTGHQPMLYVGLADENRYQWTSATKYPLWVAQYNNYQAVYGYQPRKIYGSVRYWQKMTIFQYTANGRLLGWNAGLDFDVFYGTRQDWLSMIGGKAINDNQENEDIEMTWHVAVPYNSIGACLVTNKDGAKVYTDSSLTKYNGTRKYDTSYKVGAVENGAINVGKDQWFDGRDVVTKFNPVAYNKEAKGIGQVVTSDLYTQNAIGPAKGIKHLPLNSRWQISGRNGKYLYVGNDTTGKFATGDKLYIDL